MPTLQVSQIVWEISNDAYLRSARLNTATIDWRYQAKLEIEKVQEAALTVECIFLHPDNVQAYEKELLELGPHWWSLHLEDVVNLLDDEDHKCAVRGFVAYYSKLF